MSITQLMILAAGGGGLSNFELGYFLPASYRTTIGGDILSYITDNGSGNYTLDLSSSDFTTISIFAVAGGGSGGHRNSGADWGGRGGNGGNSFLLEDLDVSSIDEIVIDVGAGGASVGSGSTANLAGITGGDTTITIDSTLVATVQGGRGATSGTGSSVNAANDANTTNLTGLVYTQTQSNLGGGGGGGWNSGAGGGGAGGYTGNGGNGSTANSTTSTNPGDDYGGGGGAGGEGGTRTTSTYGGDGGTAGDTAQYGGGGGGGVYIPYTGNPDIDGIDLDTTESIKRDGYGGGLHGGGGGGTADGQSGGTQSDKKSGAGGDGAILIVFIGSDAQLDLPLVDNNQFTI
jgi:hypothetical protein